MTEVIKITPVFAAFEFASVPQARAAWSAIDKDTSIRNISAWTAMPDARAVVVILGEKEHSQAAIDKAAAHCANADGCRGNFILDKPLRHYFVNRRYSTLVADLRERLANGETVEQIGATGIRHRRSTL